MCLFCLHFLPKVVSSTKLSSIHLSWNPFNLESTIYEVLIDEVCTVSQKFACLVTHLSKPSQRLSHITYSYLIIYVQKSIFPNYPVNYDVLTLRELVVCKAGVLGFLWHSISCFSYFLNEKTNMIIWDPTNRSTMFLTFWTKYLMFVF